ncbi:glutamate receptor 2.8-like [Abrus precatorius]|uniref:Glutamate receptor n=1 Tax=Abrus precatorius TaxID=3816 RepID=A0A8B8JSH6_ABRPR|nr:glutamate receptor 2.8-like [Abrus precatorius]
MGKLGLSCIRMALSDLYASQRYYKTRLILNVKDSMAEVIEAASVGLDLIENGKVKAIIGPQISKQANILIDVGLKYQVPIISFSATSPSLSSPQRRSPYFFRVAQNDAAQVKAISAIVQAFGWKQVVPIYSQGIYEEELIPYMTRALLEANVSTPYQSAIFPLATNQQILQELHKLKMMSNRIFIVHVSLKLGCRLFTMARNMGMMKQGYVWIMTTRMSNLLTLKNSSIIDSMQGVLGVSSYFPKTKELEDFDARWKKKFQQEYPSIVDTQINVLGLWAYDAATALAIAIEKVVLTNMRFQNTNASNNATKFGDMRLSQIGPKLREALPTIRFQGLVGEFSFVNGEVNLSSFQIININGDGKRVVGYWTPQNALQRNMDSTSMGAYSISKTNLGPIIWPGDSSSTPIGWDEYELANTNYLRVGVPFDQYKRFIDKKGDQYNNTFVLVGSYSIDVFNYVIGTLPYKVPYEFVYFANYYDPFHPGLIYDNLIKQTYLGKYDVVVGDIMIKANWSIYVDFTLPFTESGATFIVPTTKLSNKTKAWIFLKPLTWELWLTTGCFFVFIGFVVWVLEHHANEDFRGSPSHQVSTSFWFSFSTLVFAQRERVQSNLARFVVIIWIFVVLILTQSYTANLATLMTVQQLRPTVTDVSQLLQNGDFVGYRYGSYYTYESLIQMGFDNSKLKLYSTAEECDQLLTLGSPNGGISAAFDEIPYIKVILSGYCSKYTTIGPTYKTEGPGFGFAFRRGSPLVADVSRAILNLTQNNQDTMKAIEDRWFKNETHCIQPSEEDSSYKLDLESFQGLFLVAGLASSFALIVHYSMILRGHRRVFIQFDSNESFCKKIYTMFRIYFQKDARIVPDKDIWMPEVNYVAPPNPPRNLEPYA